MNRFVVVGAGVAGLTLAYYLSKAGQRVTVVEKEAEVGGLARSFHYGNYHFDIGPHRFYTANPQVMNFLREVQSTNFLEIPRFSSVYFMGHYHDWPLRLSTIRKLPPWVACRAGIDLVLKMWQPQETSPDFREYVLHRYGNTLYQTFFRDYTEKFVGIPTELTHKNWAKVGVERATIDEKIHTASLFEIFKLMLLPKPAELNFWYPRYGGIHAFWLLCAQRIRQMGGEILVSSAPKQIIYNNSQITGVLIGNQPIPCQNLIWSAPITQLSRMLNLPETGLDYRSHIVYNLLLKRQPLHNYQWCYYGAKDLVFSRLTNPVAFSRDTVPPGKGALCAEIACQENDDLWNNPGSIQKALIKNLKQVNIIEKTGDIEEIRVETVANAYPIYRLNYPALLAKAETALSGLGNITLLGRTGRFWYNNMDHSIENAISVACDLLRQLPDRDPRVDSVLQELEAYDKSEQKGK